MTVSECLENVTIIQSRPIHSDLKQFRILLPQRFQMLTPVLESASKAVMLRSIQGWRLPGSCKGPHVFVIQAEAGRKEQLSGVFRPLRPCVIR